MTTLHFSRFNGARDNVPKAMACTWEQLETGMLEQTFHSQPGRIGDEAKKSIPAISGTRFKEGTLRGCGNAVDLSLGIFDYDNSQEEHTGEFWPDKRTGKPTNRPVLRKVMIENPVAFDEVQEALRDAGVDSYSWSTWSNKPGWPKFRVVVPLAHPIPAALWEAATEWILDRLKFCEFRRGLDLPVLRDVARLNFLPAAPDPASIRRGETKGKHLDIPLESLVPAAVPPLPVAPWQAEIQEARKAAKKAGEQWYQRYRTGGQRVDFRTLNLPPALELAGIKVGSPRAFKTGTKWRCHCPLAHEHSGGVDDDCCVVIQTPGKFPSFRCAHSRHAHLTFQDVLELIWGCP